MLTLTAITAVIFTALAAYTPRDIPNVHLADRTRYVSNPDGVLSYTAETRLDSLLAGVWRSTSAEVTVVAVDSIEGDDIDSFATELFSLWGIGKKDNDNGLLILIAQAQRRAVLRTKLRTRRAAPRCHLRPNHTQRYGAALPQRRLRRRHHSSSGQRGRPSSALPT